LAGISNQAGTFGLSMTVSLFAVGVPLRSHHARGLLPA